MANSVLAKMAVEISANTAKFSQGINRIEGQFKSFTSGLSNLAGTIGLAFGTQQIASFAFEVSKLAGEAEGVRAAFDKLPESQKLMEDLKTATAGTVSELDLMKRTVQASNFGIALESLPDLLKFAAIRAQQTGQSVDYLVDSIITGIGRKSPLILDNLGISAVRLKEQFGGAALEAQSIGDVAKAVGRIASQELGKMGEFSENASTKIQRLSANFDNLKVALGTTGNSTGIFTEGVDLMNETVVNFTKFLNGPASSALTKWLKLATVVPRTAIAAANAAFSFFGETTIEEDIANFNKILADTKFPENTKEFDIFMTDLAKKADEAGKKLLVLSDGFGRTQIIVQDLPQKLEAVAAGNEKLGLTYEDLQKKLKELNDQFETATQVNDKKKLASIGAEIVATKALIAELDKLREARTKAATPNESAILQGVRDQVNKPISSLKPTFTTTNKSFGITETLPLTDETMLERIKENLMKLQVINTTTTEKIKGEWVDLSSVVGGAISDLAFSFGQAAAGVGSFGDAILKSLINFAKQFGEILIATGTAALAAKFLIKNPAAAIGAGVALLAIAGAASAALGRAQASYNSGSTSGGSSSSPRGFDSPGKVQDNKPVAEFIIRGQDLAVVLKNYDRNNRGTRTANG